MSQRNAHVHVVTMSYYYYEIVLFVHVAITIESTRWVMLKEN